MNPICDIKGCPNEAYIKIFQSPEYALMDKLVCKEHWNGDFSQLIEIQTRWPNAGDPEGAEL